MVLILPFLTYSLSMIISGSIHVAANDSISFLWLSSIPLYICTPFTLYVICRWTFRWFLCLGFPGGAVLKNPPANAGGIGDLSLIPGSERYLGGRHGNPLQYSGHGKSHGQGSLVGCSPWGRKESDTT